MLRRFILLVQRNKVNSMSYSSRTSSRKLKKLVRIELTFTMKDMHISSSLAHLRKFSTSSSSIKFKYIFPWNIPKMITKTIPVGTRIVICSAIKSLKESQQKLRQLHDQNFRNEGKPLQNKYWRQKKERNAKEQDCEQGGSRDFEKEGQGEGGGERGWRSM